MEYNYTTQAPAPSQGNVPVVVQMTQPQVLHNIHAFIPSEK